MGSPLSPIIADIVLQDLEYKALSSSPPTANSNATLNVDTSNVIFEIEEGTCVHQAIIVIFENTNDKDNIKDSAYVTEYALCNDENLNALIVNNNNMMSDSLPTTKSNAIENVSTILNELSDIEQSVQYCIHEEKIENITYDKQLNNTYSITDNNNASSNANNTHVIDISNNTFTPAAESTLIENQLNLKCEINDDNIESDTSITSKNFEDSSFHLSDCSMLENTDQDDEGENKIESTIDTSKNKTVNSTLNLTPSCSFKVCDDRNMYIETSDNPKLKRNMCPYCKKLQTQFARHLELVHKTEEDVKKFCFLPKDKQSRTKKDY
ncbi:putative uncharacterized protein DDB_G0287265 [Camponotus floridanus]|uniref:putative uncharacterized protein DDB_G0287265 n=1 Tax=Camponotus floridanus TaxID=104421 RepID=UPI000DC67FD7|nr:putative uncharacterized protein DDB_G0287265 [Camponotus floridanus]